jgi:hypothetical protein
VPDRYVLPFPRTASVASNFAYTTTHQRTVVAEAGTIRSAYAFATSVTSNGTFPSRVDFYRQPSAPALGSNTASTILVTPITVPTDLSSAAGTIRASNARVAAGDMLELRTSVNASNGELINVGGAISIERD